jgi:hypothetical protein
LQDLNEVHEKNRKVILKNNIATLVFINTPYICAKRQPNGLLNLRSPFREADWRGLCARSEATAQTATKGKSG